MNDSILITGGLGYIGGRIAQAISQCSEYNLLLSTRQNDVALPLWLDKGKVISVNLLSENDLNLACQGVKYIIHLAALNEIDSSSDPEQALMINGLGTLKLLRAAERAGVERFIYFSTAHVYGAPLQGTITEATVPRPMHPYAITHHVAEDFVLASKKLLGVVIRLSNSLGVPTHPHVNRWTLIANDLCRQAVTTHQLLLKSSGMQKRDFIALSDVCFAVTHLLRLPSSECKDGLFNLGGECTLRIIELAELVASRCQKILGFNPPIVRSNVIMGENDLELIYKIDKLKSTGFNLLGDIVNEIDATLEFCSAVLC
ncbi:MAG: SDR family oxidoreductase [Veillonellales bacterium]